MPYPNGVWYQSAVSGMWYQNYLAAGTISRVKIDGVVYCRPDREAEDDSENEKPDSD